MNMSTVKKLLLKRGAIVALLSVTILIMIDTLLTYQYKQTLNFNIQQQKQLGEILRNKGNIITNLNNIDMSIRGFLLVGNEAFVDTYKKIKAESTPQMAYLAQHLPGIGVSPDKLNDMNDKLSRYFGLMEKLIANEKAGNHAEALAILKEDYGTTVWMTYVKLSELIDPIVSERTTAAEKKYDQLLSFSLIFQVVLFLVGIPTLAIACIQLLKGENRRIKLYANLDQSNRKLIFDSGEAINTEDEKLVISSMIANLEKTSTFIKGISAGELEVNWNGFSASKANNNHAISGELLNMRNEMRKMQDRTKKEQWVSEGLNNLNALIRKHQEDFEQLCSGILSFIVKYVSGQQGSFFILNDNDKEDKFIELKSCYAFDKRKFVSKRIEFGSGMLGQAFLEAQPVFLKDVPKDYVAITSGLGEANPTCLVIYPLLHDDKVVGLIEIASFIEFDVYSRDFLAIGCKNIASAITSLRSNEKTRVLLEQSQEQAEQMRAQEEEIRQNMEELQATQEEMKRRETELKLKLEDALRKKSA
jgi:CHASE3 domain sensor protein